MKKDQQHTTPKGNLHPSKKDKNNDNTRQPDPETLGTTDPQEHMEGPISSLVQKTRKKVEENNSETPEDAAHKK